MDKPVIAVLQRDPDALVELLARHYQGDYDVEAFTTTAELLDRFATVRAAGRHAALVLADMDIDGASTLAALGKVRDVGEHTVRVALLPVGNRASFAAGRRLLTAHDVGEVDRFLGVPWGNPHVGLYPVLTQLLAGWWQVAIPDRDLPILATIVAPPFSPRAAELRDLLDRNRIPAAFLDHGTDEARHVLAAAGQDEGGVVVVVAADGTVLVDPANHEIADHLGAQTRPPTEADVAIVGGGPAGLAAAVYAGSEGLRTVIVERAAVGGQAGTSSHIRNYPGFPHGVTGTELAERASQQAWLFGVDFVLTNPVTSIAVVGDRHRLRLADGSTLTVAAVVIASGVEYRRLDAPGVERLLGAGVFYGAARAEAPAFAGRHVYLVGAGNSAGQAAAHLARYAGRVTLLVRGASLATSMSDYLVRQLARTANVDVLLRTQVAAAGGGTHLERLELDTSEGRRSAAADGLFIMIGAQPRTDWLPTSVARGDRGYVLTGDDVPVVSGDGRAALPFETSLPGVFAVGDVRHGSVKRVASAVGEGAVSISSVHRYLEALAATAAGV